MVALWNVHGHIIAPDRGRGCTYFLNSRSSGWVRVRQRHWRALPRQALQDHRSRVQACGGTPHQQPVDTEAGRALPAASLKEPPEATFYPKGGVLPMIGARDRPWTC